LVDVSLVDFFRTISELTGLNILIDPDIKGTITINVEEVPWDLLFETVLKSHGLERTIEGNLVRIATKKTLEAEEKNTQALKEAAFKATDTVTVTAPLNYAVAPTLAKALEKQLTTRGRIDVEPRSNTLIVTDVPPSVDRLMTLIKTLDVPEPQVEIESRIIETTTSFSRRLGAEFLFFAGKDTDRVRGWGGSVAPIDPARDKPAIGAAEIAVGRVLDTVMLDAFIEAGESVGEVRILSKPKVTTVDGAEATIVQGTKIPISVIRNFQTSVEYHEAALRLRVTPRITDERTVQLFLKIDNDVPDFSRTVLGIPTILISQSQSVVLLPDGGTTMIGGIFVEQDRDNVDKVPALGDVPVVGNLFKRTSKARETREILFLITTRIVS
ncbi:MAG TPA: type IV pilus secretin PilQ, partial [Acidobacteriota bacterium]|nr:type IV pilus secretin PilQ [Acidobacteriota bacterium]